MTPIQCLLAVVLSLGASWAMAADKPKLLIGQTVAVTGPPSGAVAEMLAGARIIIDKVNAAGGVRGQQVEILTLDDGADPERAYENTKTLVQEKKVLAMLLSSGTPTTERILPLLANANAPLIGPSSGAQSLRQPVVRTVFNVRVAYRNEAKRVVEQLLSMGHKDIAIVKVNDNFGGDSLAGAVEAITEAGLKPVLVQTLDPQEPEVGAAIAEIVDAKPHAVFVAASTGPTASIIKGLRSRGDKSSIATMSINASNEFVDMLGEAARGVMVAQVMPNERGSSAPLVLEVREGAHAQKMKVSAAMLEGATSAKLLVEALRRTKGPLTRQSLLHALESTQGFDLGWGTNALRYTPDDHEGMTRTELAVIGSDGQFIR